jgi:hypothetical protein
VHIISSWSISQVNTFGIKGGETLLTIQIKGPADQVMSLIKDLQQHSKIEVELQGNQSLELLEEREVKVTCFLRHTSESNWRLSLSATNGEEVMIPFLDFISVELEEGKKIITGRSFDIFG